MVKKFTENNTLVLHPKWCKTLQETWSETIPITEHMGIKLYQYTGRTLETRASLNKNINIQDLQNNNFSSLNNRASKLSYLIQSNNDFFVSSILMTRPNFISEKKVKSNVLNIDQKKDSLINLNNKIILIENADPGYDWIFSYKIRGLITKYGGVNSHMSIRCEEKQLPAIIGVGDELFESLKKEKNLEIDCKLQKINFFN